MSLSQRRKGMEAERAFARAIGGTRIPLSGAAGGEFTGDVKALGLRFQVKMRGTGGGFKSLYEWLKDHEALAIRRDRAEWLVVLPVTTLLNLLQSDTNIDKGAA